VRPATAIESRRDLERYVLRASAGLGSARSTQRRIRKLPYDLCEETVKRAPTGRSWATVRRILAPLSVMLSATEDGVIAAKPWPRLPTPQDRLVVRFLAETGLRISELKALRWGDLALDDELVVSVRRRHRLLDGEQQTKSERRRRRSRSRRTSTCSTTVPVLMRSIER